MLSHFFWHWHPRLGNPGSSTEMCKVFKRVAILPTSGDELDVVLDSNINTLKVI